MWFGHVKRRDLNYSVWEDKRWIFVPPGRRLRGSFAKRTTKTGTDSLCQQRPKSYIRTTEDDIHPCQNWVYENCVCHSDPTITWEQLVGEEYFMLPNPTVFAFH